MIIVSDTSAISSLLTIGRIEILAQLFREVVIPVSVYSELLRTHNDLPKWVRVEAVKDLRAALDLRKQVDAGEAEAIQLAKEIPADQLLIDDLKGRILAEKQGLRIIGLLGVLLLAKRKKLIPSARELIDRLRLEADFYLSDDVINEALRSVAE